MKQLWLPLTGVVLLVSFVLDLVLLHNAHAAFWWQVTPAFDVLFGLGGCAVFILGARWLGQSWLQRNEDYYQEEP